MDFWPEFLASSSGREFVVIHLTHFASGSNRTQEMALPSPSLDTWFLLKVLLLSTVAWPHPWPPFPFRSFSSLLLFGLRIRLFKYVIFMICSSSLINIVSLIVGESRVFMSSSGVVFDNWERIKMNYYEIIHNNCQFHHDCQTFCCLLEIITICQFYRNSKLYWCLDEVNVMESFFCCLHYA